jgi:RNA polymerase sigma-70 factor (ECF subfamily)
MMGQALVATTSAHERTEPFSRAAFDDLVQRYQAPLARFLYGMLHDADQAADLCQETFLSAFKAAPRITGELNVDAWLYTIALNHARAYLRRKRLLHWVPFVGALHDRPAPGGDTASRVAQRDELRQVLTHLSTDQRACLLLHAEGFRYAEIAQVLGCTEGAVKVRIFRARERCLALFRDEKEDA